MGFDNPQRDVKMSSQPAYNPGPGAKKYRTGSRTAGNPQRPAERTQEIQQSLEEASNMDNQSQQATQDFVRAVVEGVRVEIAKELGEANAKSAKQFGEAKTEMAERFGEMKTEMAERFGEMKTEMAKQFDEVNAKSAERFGEVTTAMAKQFDEVNRKNAERFGAMDTATAKRFGEVKTEMAERLGAANTENAKREKRQLVWLVGTIIAVASLMTGLIRLWTM